MNAHVESKSNRFTADLSLSLSLSLSLVGHDPHIPNTPFIQTSLVAYELGRQDN